MSVTRDFTTSATTAASTTTSSGASITASAGVPAFNASAGYSTNTSDAMEVSNAVSRTVSQNVTVPAGQSFVQFVGHRVTNAKMQRHYCNSTGTAISTTWRGTVFGPQFPVDGFEDCRDTPLC